MTRRVFWTLIFATIATASWKAFAHPGHVHKIMGTVSRAAADHVMLKTKDGKDVTVKVAATTKVMQGTQAVKVESLTAGTRIVITTTGAKAPYTAKLIQVGPTPKATASAKK